MRNKLLIVIGAILGILIIGFFTLSLTLDGLIKSNIQQTGGSLLKTEVEVHDVAVSILDGTGTIDGLMIHNPEGFEDRAAIQFKQVKLQLALSSLLSDTIIVKNLTVQNPGIYVEQNTNGNNLSILQDRLDSSSEESYETHLVIHHLLINKGSVHLRSKIGEERNIKAEIAQLALTDVGRKGNSSIDQTIRQVLKPVLERAIAQAAKEGIRDVVEDKVQDLLDN